MKIQRPVEVRLTITDVLEKIGFRRHTSSMSNREIVEDLLQRIPEDASLHDITQQIEFIAAVRQGLDELDRGETIPIEEVERELPSWIIR
jgi:predicted transcriptional regulator